MPLPSLLCFVFAAGLAFALAGRAELRLSPRPALLSASAAATVLYCVLLVVPVSVFFYVFYGDWFMAYTVDVSRIPSALALLGFIFLVLEGLLGFWIGAALARSQRDAVGGALLAVAAISAAGAALLLRGRLSMVGNHAQFTRGFGLKGFDEGALAPCVWTMSFVLILGLIGSAARLFLARRGVGA